MITSFSSKIEELQVRDKKREMALEAANSLLDKELTRVSTFVEDKVRQIFKKYMYNDTKYLYSKLIQSKKVLSSKDFSKIQDSQKTPLPEKHVSIH